MVSPVNGLATLDGYSPPTSEVTAAATAVQSRASLTVVTAEGDRVTLSSNYAADSAAIGYDARGHLGTDLAASSRSVTQSVSVEIDGNLSAEERKDLRAVAKAFQEAVKHGSAEAFTSALDEKDVDSLATIAGEYQTTSATLFAASSSGPSALPAHPPSTGQIGTPPLAKAIDLLRTMMMALRSGRSDESSQVSPRPQETKHASETVETPPSNVAEA